MRQRLLNHGSFLVILSVVLTFLAASVVMYDKFSVSMKQGVRDEVEYILSLIHIWSRRSSASGIQSYRTDTAVTVSSQLFAAGFPALLCFLWIVFFSFYSFGITTHFFDRI